MASITFEDLAALLEEYRSCGFTDTRDFSFIESVVNSRKMPHGGGIGWLERIVSAGSPVGRHKEIAEIEELAAKSSRKDTADILRSFATRIRQGNSLSDRQRAFMATLVSQVNENAPDVILTDRQHDLLKFLTLSKKINYFYWNGRPGISGRLDRIFLRLSTDSAISQVDLDYVRENFKGAVHDFEEGGLRHPVGKLRWLGDGTAVTVMGNTATPNSATVMSHVIHIDVYHPMNGVIAVPVRSLYIRPPKKVCN